MVDIPRINKNKLLVQENSEVMWFIRCSKLHRTFFWEGDICFKRETNNIFYL